MNEENSLASAAGSRRGHPIENCSQFAQSVAL
jgi:hypothetical protein